MTRVYSILPKSPRSPPKRSSPLQKQNRRASLQTDSTGNVSNLVVGSSPLNDSGEVDLPKTITEKVTNYINTDEILQSFFRASWYNVGWIPIHPTIFAATFKNHHPGLQFAVMALGALNSHQPILAAMQYAKRGQIWYTQSIKILEKSLKGRERLTDSHVLAMCILYRFAYGKVLVHVVVHFFGSS